MVNAFDVKLNADLLGLAYKDTSLKRVASTGGGEYSGPCPFCGGDDRFHVQVTAPPGKKPTGSRWMCRVCSPQWGDVIGYVEKRENCDFQTALKWLADWYNIQSPDPEPVKAKKQQEIDRDRWSAMSKAFVNACIDKLWSDEGTRALNYLHGRGLDDETLKSFQIGFCPREGGAEPESWGLPEGERIYIPRGIVIPCIDSAGLHYVKVRQSQGDPKYLMIKGGQVWPFGLWTFPDARIAFLFESELDVCLAYATGFIGVGYASLPAGQYIQSSYAPFFENIESVLVALDNDDAGREGSKKLCKISGFHPVQPLPAGKDVTEYYQQTRDLGAVFEWLYAQVGTLQP